MCDLYAISSPREQTMCQKRCCTDVERLQTCSLPALDLGSSISLRHPSGAVGGTTTAKLMVRPQ